MPRIDPDKLNMFITVNVNGREVEVIIPIWFNINDLSLCRFGRCPNCKGGVLLQTSSYGFTKKYQISRRAWRAFYKCNCGHYPG